MEDQKTPLQQFTEAVMTDEQEIEILRRELQQVINIVHQAYHGGRAPDDLSDANWETCPMAVCRRVQQVLSPKRPRGHR